MLIVNVLRMATAVACRETWAFLSRIVFFFASFRKEPYPRKDYCTYSHEGEARSPRRHTFATGTTPLLNGMQREEYCTHMQGNRVAFPCTETLMYKETITLSCCARRRSRTRDSQPYRIMQYDSHVQGTTILSCHANLKLVVLSTPSSTVRVCYSVV